MEILNKFINDLLVMDLLALELANRRIVGIESLVLKQLSWDLAAYDLVVSGLADPKLYNLGTAFGFANCLAVALILLIHCYCSIVTYFNIILLVVFILYSYFCLVVINNHTWIQNSSSTHVQLFIIISICNLFYF